MVQEPKLTIESHKKKMKRLMSKTMPKSGLISSKNLNEPHRLSIITEQEFEESKPDTEISVIHVPVTAENAFRLGFDTSKERLPFKKTSYDLSFGKKKFKPRKPVKKIQKAEPTNEVSSVTELGQDEID